MSSIYRRGKLFWYKAYKDRRPIYRALDTQDRQEAKFLQAKLDIELSTNTLSPTDTDLAGAIARYLESLKARCSAKYQYEVGHRLRLITKHIRTVQEITEPSVIDSLKQFPGEYDYNNSVSAIKGFINWCVRTGYLNRSPIQGIKKITIQESPRVSFTDDEVSRIIEAASTEVIYPAILTAIYSGMRKSELLGMTWENVDLKERVFVLNKTKNRKVRRIPIHQDVYAVLAPIKPKEGRLFVTANNRRILRRVFKRASVVGGWHHFRHTFATHLLRSGIDLKTVCTLCGHSSIQITSKYLSTTPAHMAEAVQKLQFSYNNKKAPKH